MQNMTDEEKAEEYLRKNKICNNENWEVGGKYCYTLCKQAYLDGIVEGRKGKNYFNKFVQKCKENEELEKIRSGQVKIMESDLTRIEKLKKENEQLKTVCDYNCPVHKLATHNACLACPAVRNSPHHDLKNVTDEELQKIIKDAEAEMEM